MQSIQDLSQSLDTIKTTLNKGLYTNSPEMMSKLAVKLRDEASNAKTALSHLPVDELDLSATYKYLSQVGNYSQSLAKKYTDGEELTGNEKETMMTLFGYAEDLSGKMWAVEEQIQNGTVTLAKANQAANKSGSDEAPASVTDGFKNFEESFTDYPALIYDGPFSDHILQKESEMLKGQQEISADDAMKKAAKVSGCDTLTQGTDETGKMPSYTFECGETTVSITKQGGFFCYMMKYRTVGDQTITVEQAIEAATKYMKSLGMDEMTNTYYEINNGCCIINFAGLEKEVVLYTDLCKVGVALDNGEIISFDARGYINNHTDRGLKNPELSLGSAQEKVAPNLNVKGSSLCLIPSDGMNELYCYEFDCTDDSGRRVLVYINCSTGKEEQILLLQISGNGMLTV